MKNELGVVIACCRKHSLLKQDYVAFKLGLSTAAYANIERGRSDVSSEKLSSIARLFGLRTYQLVILAEELMDVREDTWLSSVVKGMIKISKPNQIETLSLEETFLINMDKSIRKAI